VRETTNTHKLSCLLLLITLIFGTYSQGQSSKKIKVFILAGQSNMDGRGDASKLTSQELNQLKFAQERVQYYYKGSVSKKDTIVVSGPLQVTNPWKFVQQKFRLEKCFGPELFFGMELAGYFPDKKFMFIKRSQGGTSLYGAWNPNWSIEKASLIKEQDKPQLFADMIKVVDAQLKSLSPNEYELAGMLWVQGESDSGKRFGPLPSETYGLHLQQLIESVRSYYKRPDLPFLMLNVGGGKVIDGMEETSKKVHNVTLIKRSKNPSNPNYTPIYTHNWNGKPAGHYNYTGMKKIGQLFFEAYVNNYVTFITE